MPLEPVGMGSFFLVPRAKGLASNGESYWVAEDQDLQQILKSRVFVLRESSGEGGATFTMTTTVWFASPLGRLYFLLIMLVHHLFVWRMTRKAAAS